MTVRPCREVPHVIPRSESRSESGIAIVPGSLRFDAAGRVIGLRITDGNCEHDYQPSTVETEVGRVMRESRATNAAMHPEFYPHG